MYGSTDWTGIAGFIIAIATLIPVLVTSFIQIKQNGKINETHTAVTPKNGEPPMVQQVAETNVIAHDAQSTVNDIKTTVDDVKNIVQNGGSK